MATERTPLRTGGPAAGPGAYDQAPTYVFMSSPGRAHRNKIRQFQCCVCAAILGVFVMALVITISYSVEHDDADEVNATTTMPPIPVNDTLQLLLRSSWPRPDAASPAWPEPAPDDAAMQRAVQAGRAELATRTALEAKMIPMKKDTPAYRANQAVHTRREATALAQRALLEEKATKQLLKASGRKLSQQSGAGRGPRLRLAAADSAEAAACAEEDKPLPCPASAYRSADGSCNNVQHPRSWGVAMRPFRRVMPPAYVDGVSEPRGLAQGLPSAREVSLGVHRPLYRNDPDFTVMLAVWGQFIDHDITNTALSQAADGTAISCCDQAAADEHPECFPVRLAPGDPYYHKYNVTCMEFVRSAPAPTCSLGQREQLNQASSFLDASVVYGPTPELMRSLREEPSTEAAAEDGDDKGKRAVLGRLKMTMSPDGRELLPVSEDPDDGCNRQEMNDRGRYCFKSGDGRANENLHLTTMHLLLARQHNRVASMLQNLNPQWNDERVFQESRRIVAAQMQHVTYNEFLPVILGPRMMEKMDLQPKAAGYDSSYDPEVDPTICNSFAASSFRFAHTLLPGLLKLIGNDTSSTEYMELHQMLFDPYSLYSREGADRALRGAMDTSVERADNYFNPELTQKLFAPRSIGRGSSGQPACGLDLVSLNVQRGRDHGLQPYPAWREHCGFPKPTSWDDLDGVVDEDSLKRMKEIYKSVDDVDVYTGVLSEYPVEDGLLGGTLTCLLGDQFVRLKRGDRFWYETDQQPQAFTPAQLAEIRKTSLAGVICGTSDGVHSAQPLVMRRVRADSNKRVPCAQLPRTNLRAWVERDGRYVYRRADALQATGHAPKDQDNVPDELVLVGASPDNAGLTATTARAVRVGGRVTSGSVVTASGTSLWSGSLPTAIPVPALGAKAFLAGGVQWQGSLVSTGDTASLRGSFSVDSYSAQPGGPPQEAESIAGTFSVQMDVLWDSSSDGVIDLSGSFQSPIFLRAEDGRGDAPLVNAKGGSGPMAPVILHGSHAADGSFLWNGNVTLVLPTMAEEEPVDDAPPPLLTASAYSVGAPSKNARLVVEVQSGTVTAQPADGGAEVTWWDGDLPASIPTSLFDAKDSAASGATTDPADLARPAARVDGVLWTAKVAASSATTAQVSGTFKAPRFVHGNYSGAGVKVQWWSGSFALNVRLLVQPDDGLGLDSLLVSGQHYTSRLVFEADTPSALDPSPEPRGPLALLAAAQEVVDGAAPAPIILKGAFSADRASFSWSGKAILVLPRPAAMPSVQLLGTPKKTAVFAAPLRAPSAGEVKLAATVKSGKVTAARDGASSESTLWSGAFPAAIPLPLFDAAADGTATTPAAGVDGEAPLYAHGVVWQGTLSPSGATLSLKGTFKAPRYLHAPDNTTFAMEWWKGSFSFELEPQWMSVASLDGVVSSTATYSSPVYFKALREASVASTASASGTQRTPLAAFVAASLEESEGALRAPVILQGTYSADRTTFYWTGAVVLALPRPDGGLVAEQPLLQAKPGKPGKPSKAVKKDDAKPSKPSKPVKPPSLRLASMVLGGSVNGTYDNSTTVTELWTGTVPMWLPSPLFGVASWDLDQTVKWSGTLTTLDKTGKLLQLDGTFEAPYFEQGTDGMVEHKWKGEFSLQLRNLYTSVTQPQLLKPNKVMKSRIVFAMAKSASGDSAMPQLTLQSETGENQAVIVLQGQYWFWSKSWFWWNGMASVSLPVNDDVTEDPNQYVKPEYNKLKAAPGASGTNLAVPKSIAVTVAAKPPPAVRRIGIRVTSGNMYAYPEGAWFWRTWWTGSLPASIPVPVFDSYKSEYAPYPTGPLFHACGVDWTGKITATSPTTVKIEGKFSMPNYQHGPGGVVITWYYGTFLFEGNLLWSTNLNGLDALDGTSFSSHLYFKSEKVVPMSKYPVQSSASSLQQFVADSAAIASGAVRVPVVLDGSYSADRKTFLWSGDAVLTVPDPQPPLLQAKPGKAIKKDDGAPTKPSKPVKPPKLRIAAMVLGGSVNATYDNSTATELWSGAVPMWLPNPLFGISSFDLDQTIKWSGSLTVLDKTGKMLQLDGKFEAPYFEQGVDGIVEHKWKGTFSLQLRNLYTSVTQPQLLKPNTVMKSRVVFAMPKAAPGEPATPQLMVQSETGDNLAVIVLQGQYWFWSKSWYWWNGVASVALPLDDDVTEDPNQYVKPEYNKLQAAPGASGKKAAPASKLAVAVVEGLITAGKEDDPSTTATWWSGELPATIPAMPFDGDASDASSPFNRSAVTPGGVARGVSWTGALRPLPGEDDAMLEGSFRFPRFLHPSAAGSSFALEWWTGQFSLRLRALAGTSLSGVLAKTATYSSPLVFKAMSPDDSITSLLQQPAVDVGVSFVMASDAKAAGAAKLPILLQGSYSPDGGSFLWTGNAILQVPASAAKQMRPLKLTASATKVTASKSSSSAVSKIGAVVTSGTVSVGKAGEAAATVWSGTFPASLPAGAAGPASVLWSGSLQQQSDALTAATLTGTFSTALPEDSGNGTMAWWSGDFSLQLQLLWNVSLAGCIRPGVKYVTPLYYRGAAQQLQQGQQVAALSQELASAGEKVLAFLDGSYNADKTAFMWSGKVFLTLPKSCGKPGLAPLNLKASADSTAAAAAAAGRRITLGGVVTSGWVTPSLWGGALPAAIPVAAIRSVRPLTWSGTLSRGAASTVTIKGSFSAPQYHHDAGTFSVDWVTGDFSFSARLLWDSGAALDAALTASANYTSPIYLQNSDSLRALEDVQDRVPAVWDRMVDKVTGPVAPAANKVPVVLQGEFAADGATFWWSGGVLISLPAAT